MAKFVKVDCLLHRLLHGYSYRLHATSEELYNMAAAVDMEPYSTELEELGEKVSEIADKIEHDIKDADSISAG